MVRSSTTTTTVYYNQNFGCHALPRVQQKGGAVADKTHGTTRYDGLFRTEADEVRTVQVVAQTEEEAYEEVQRLHGSPVGAFTLVDNNAYRIVRQWERKVKG